MRITTLLAAMMALIAISGCGSGGGAAQTVSSTQAVTAIDARNVQGPVAISGLPARLGSVSRR